MESQQKKSEKLRIFSERFKSALARANFQDNEIAWQLGVAPSAISNWRQGLNMAKGKNLRRLAEVLNCRPGWLLGEEAGGPADPLGRARTPHGKDSWQQRAIAAEKQLADLRSGLQFLLETSGELPHAEKKRAVRSLPGGLTLKKTQSPDNIRPGE